MRVCLVLVALMLCGCSSPIGEPSASESQAVVPAGCTAAAAPTVCDPWLGTGANWVQMQCPYNVDPGDTTPAVKGIGCTGTWIGNYTPTGPWLWCCPK